MNIPMNPLGAAIISVASGGGLFLMLCTLNAGQDTLGPAIAGAVTGMLTFGILVGPEL